MKKTIILSTIIGSLFFMSCTEESVNPTTRTVTDVTEVQNLNEQLLGSWTEVGLTVNPAVKIGDNETTNPFEFKADCLKDDVITLKTSNQMDRDLGNLKCDSKEIPAPGSWELHEDRNTLILDGQKYQILDVEEDHIRLSYEINKDKITYVYTTTFARK
jgi:hypothetical protein